MAVILGKPSDPGPINVQSSVALTYNVPAGKIWVLKNLVLSDGCLVYKNSGNGDHIAVIAWAGVGEVRKCVPCDVILLTGQQLEFINVGGSGPGFAYIEEYESTALLGA